MKSLIFGLVACAFINSAFANTSCSGYCVYEIYDSETKTTVGYGSNMIPFPSRTDGGHLLTVGPVDPNNFSDLQSECEENAEANIVTRTQLIRKLAVYSTTVKKTIYVYANFGHYLYNQPATPANSCQ
jgi:hypothetical protein